MLYLGHCCSIDVRHWIVGLQLRHMLPCQKKPHGMSEFLWLFLLQDTISSPLYHHLSIFHTSNYGSCPKFKIMIKTVYHLDTICRPSTQKNWLHGTFISEKNRIQYLKWTMKKITCTVHFIKRCKHMLFRYLQMSNQAYFLQECFRMQALLNAS